MGQIFVAFSEYLNFTHVKSYKNAQKVFMQQNTTNSSLQLDN